MRLREKRLKSGLLAEQENTQKPGGIGRYTPLFEKGGNRLSMGILLQQSVLGTV